MGAIALCCRYQNGKWDGNYYCCYYFFSSSHLISSHEERRVVRKSEQDACMCDTRHISSGVWNIQIIERFEVKLEIKCWIISEFGLFKFQSAVEQSAREKVATIPHSISASKRDRSMSTIFMIKKSPNRSQVHNPTNLENTMSYCKIRDPIPPTHPPTNSKSNCL